MNYLIEYDEIIKYEKWESIIFSLDLEKRAKSAKTIAIKLNMAAGNRADPNKHICSDVRLLSNVIMLCHEMNPEASILICESDSTGYGFAYDKFAHFNLPGCLNLSQSALERVKLVDLSRDKLVNIYDKRFKYFKNERQLWISKAFMEADIKISLSNLKMHSVTKYTGACKNLFGCLPALEKNIYHPYIHEVIYDLALAINPDLSFVDAYYSMEGNGPVGGQDVSGGFRIISTNVAVADYIGAAFAGYRIESIKYLKYLSSIYPIEKSLAEVKAKGKNISMKKPGKCYC